MFRILIGLLFLGLLQQAHASPDIIGGLDVSKGDPYVSFTVGLQLVTPRGVGTCTASLIASDLAVTAAHCVSDGLGGVFPGENLFIIFNVELSGAPEKRRVIAALPHPNYHPSRGGKDQNDIAVVRFSGGLAPGYKPAQLLVGSTALKKGGLTTLIGYGVNHMDIFGGDGAGILRKVDVKIANPKFGKTEVLLDQTQGKGACHGDSGGPAVIAVKGAVLLWGVTNRGYPETAPDDCAHYSVYTRIQAHAAFLNQAIVSLRKLK